MKNLQPIANSPGRRWSEDGLLDVAARAARAAGEMHRQCRLGELAVDHALDHDLKLAADRLSEAAAFAVIREAAPESTIISEESAKISGAGELVWIVDPLDGTVNYFHGLPLYCACVACHRKTDAAAQGLAGLGEPLAAAVYAAEPDELFAAAAGGVATLNGKAIAPAPVKELGEVFFSTSFGSREATMRRMENLLHTLVRKTRKVRVLGSCGLDLCAVACGRLSALYQEDVRCWDFAAARLVLERAGAGFAAVETAPNRWNVLAAAPGVFPELAKLTGISTQNAKPASELVEPITWR